MFKSSIGFIVIGFLFIFYSGSIYLKVIKNVGVSYKITKVSKKMNIFVLVLMTLFLSIYSFILLEIILGKIKVDISILIISILLCCGGIFVYLAIILLEILFKNVENSYIRSINGLIGIFELRDKYTRGHSEHVALLSEKLYDNLPKNLKDKVSKNDLIMAALLHDIGKIMIPESILNKKENLTEDEYGCIKKHAGYSGKILKSFEFFEELSNIVKYHHERVDGRGYYSKVKDEIPLESRIIAVADVYSAMTTTRVYRRKYTKIKAVELLKEVSGTQLDAELVTIFIKILEEGEETFIEEKDIKEKDLHLRLNH